jgi:hypothetical protein
LNEEKLCQLLANQTRALQKRQPQAASHAHHLQIRPPQRQASLRVPATAVQVQTSSHVKMVAEVVQNSAQPQLTLRALHALRVHSSKLVLLSNTVTQVARHTETVTIARLAKTAVGTRVVQSVHHMVTATHVLHTVTVTIVRLAATVRHTETVTTLVAQSVLLMVTVTHVLHMVVQVQQRVAATLVK